jgi:hypothetical protein
MRRRTNSIEHCTRESKFCLILVQVANLIGFVPQNYGALVRSAKSIFDSNTHPNFHLEPFSQRWDCHSKQEV